MSGIKMAQVQYTCRVCGMEKGVMVMPLDGPDGLVIDLDSKHKLYRGRCDECGVEDRTHVASRRLSRRSTASEPDLSTDDVEPWAIWWENDELEPVVIEAPTREAAIEQAAEDYPNRTVTAALEKEIGI